VCRHATRGTRPHNDGVVGRGEVDFLRQRRGDLDESHQLFRLNVSLSSRQVKAERIDQFPYLCQVMIVFYSMNYTARRRSLGAPR